MTTTKKNKLQLSLPDFELPDWIQITPVSLRFTKPPKFEEWEAVVPKFGRWRRALPFLIGDFVNLGQAAFGEMYSQALELFGPYEYNTIANYASVMGRIPDQVRRVELSYSHHALVAKLEQQDQIKWLERAVYDPDEGRMLTSEELKALLDEAYPKAKGDGGDQEEGDPEARMSYAKLGEKILKLLGYMAQKAPDSFERELIKNSIGRIREALGKEKEKAS